MSEYDDILAVGVNVDIQRTDGRVHSAIVSSINASKKSVTVEWYERGEAKGKEIEYAALFGLNPNLRRPGPSPDTISGTGDVSRNHSHQEPQLPLPRPNVAGASGGDLRANLSNISVNQSADLQSTVIANPSRVTAPSASRVPAPSKLPTTSNAVTRRTVLSTYEERGQSRLQAPTSVQSSIDSDAYRQNVFRPVHNREELMDVDAPKSLHEGLNGLAHTACDRGQSLLTNTDVMDYENTATDIDDSAVTHSVAADARRQNGNAVSTASTMRKSNCVKEIERIQQRREERRAAQKAVRDQSDFDPSNPSYDFYMMIQEYRSTIDYRPLTNADTIEDHQICVCVRKRPMNKKELNKREIDVITVPNKQQVLVHEPKTKVDLTKYLENQQFRFDYTFDDNSDNELVYRYTAKPLVNCIFEGGMATCFAYGQTGSGKTHTMGGEFQSRGQQNCADGIYAFAAGDVFQLLNTTYRQENLRVDAAFFEIYSGKVFDLLNKKAKLRVLEDAKGQVQIVGLCEENVTSVNCVLKLLQHGAHIRTSGQTSANQHSSRSHAVFQLILKKPSGKIHGKFSLIDLAGNERGVDTSSSDRHTRMEGAEINKSLLALKECIRALGRRGAHLPFRASKLTQVLRDSFIGDRSRTCMIATISPGMCSCEHTLNTLRYADRVKELGPSNLSTSNSSIDLIGQAANQVPVSARVTGTSRGGNTTTGTGVSEINGTSNKSAFPNNSTNQIWQQSTLTDNRGLCDPLLGDDDLAMLRSANKDEVSEEVFHFHEVIDHIERMEEEICDDHKAICDSMTTWNKEHNSLYRLSNQFEYDVESYSSRLENLLGKQIKALSALRDKVTLWRRDLRQEEEISSNLHRTKKP